MRIGILQAHGITTLRVDYSVDCEDGEAVFVEEAPVSGPREAVVVPASAPAHGFSAT
jgi:hypothetical protein